MFPSMNHAQPWTILTAPLAAKKLSNRAALRHAWM